MHHFLLIEARCRPTAHSTHACALLSAYHEAWLPQLNLGNEEFRIKRKGPRDGKMPQELREAACCKCEVQSSDPRSHSPSWVSFKCCKTLAFRGPALPSCLTAGLKTVSEVKGGESYSGEHLTSSYGLHMYHTHICMPTRSYTVTYTHFFFN